MNKILTIPVYRFMTYARRGVCVLAVFLALAFGSVYAQTTNTFTGASGGTWSTAANWSLGTVPVSSDNVLINSNTMVNLYSNGSAAAMTLSGNNARLNIAGVSLAATGITMTGASGNNVPIYMDGGTMTLNGGSGSIATTGGTSYLHINGPVTLNLASANLTYLWLKSGGGAPSSLTITNGQTLTAAVTYLAGIPASGQSTLNLNGGTLNAGTMIFNVTAGSYTNTFNLNSGTLTADVIRRDFDGTSTTFNFNDGTIATRSNASLTISRGANATQNMVISLAGTGTHTFQAESGRTITVDTTAVLADKAGEVGTLVKAGAGTLTLSGNNTYSGSTTVTGGTLTLNSGQAIPDNGVVTLSDSNGVSLAVKVSETIGSLRGGGANGGNVSLSDGHNLTVVETGNQTFAGQITGAGGLVKSGSGTLSLTKNNNSFVGGVTIDGGTLRGTNGAISSFNTVVVNSGGTLGMGATDTWGGAAATSTIPVTINSGGNMTSDNQFNTLRDLTLNGGSVTLNGGHPAGAFCFGGTVSVNGAFTSTITTTTGSNNILRIGRQGETNTKTIFDVTDPAGLLTVNATLDNPFDVAAGLDKGGPGKMVLLGTNAYTGLTTVSGGILQVGNGGTTGNLGPATSEIAISDGATLAFNRSDNYGGNFTRKLSGGGGVSLSSGTLVLANTANSFTGGVTVNGGMFKTSGNSAGSNIVVNSGGTFAMAGTDTWGSARISNSPAVTINSGGTMTSDNQFNSLRDLTLNGGSVNLNGGLASTASAFVLGGTVTAGGALTSLITATTGSNNAIRLGREGSSEPTTFNVSDPSGQLLISAPLTNNFGSVSGLQKTGDGTLVLSGANGYSGTNKVSGGTLVVSNSIFTATIQSGSTTVNFATLPSPGTNNVLPGPLDAASLASVNLTGPGTISGTLTNSPNLKVIVTSSAPVGPTFASTYPSGSENTVGSNGLQNLMSYALGGTGPGSTPALPVLTSDGTNLTLTANIRNDGQGVGVVGQYAYTLDGPWNDVTLTPTGATSTVANTTVKAFSQAIETGQPRKFLRFKATLIP